MTLRDELERREHRYLHPKAAFADETVGRPLGDKVRDHDVRTCY